MPGQSQEVAMGCHRYGYDLGETLFSLPGSSVGDPRTLIPALFGEGLDTLWVAGDGNRPTRWRGVPLAPGDPDPLTATGAPGSLDGPWQLEGGGAVSMETYTGAESRMNATPRDPAVGEDAIVVAWGRMPILGAGGRVFNSRSAATGQGIDLYIGAATSISIYIRTGGGAATAPGLPVGSVTQSGIFICIALIDRAADAVTLWSPGGSVGPSLFADGAITGSGISIAGYINGAAPRMDPGSGLFGVAYYIGAGIAPAWAAGTYARCKALARYIKGIYPKVGGDLTSFTRTTARSRYDRNSRLWLFSSGNAAAGDSEAMLFEPARTNLAYNTINPSVTTGLTASGGTLTAANADAAALATAKLECLGPSVFKFIPGAGDETVQCGANTGATTKHSISVYMRGNAGAETVHLGLWDASAGAFTSHGDLALTTAWQRFVLEDQTPGDTDCSWCIESHAGDTIYFVGQQLELGAVVSSPIPNWATAASATRNADDLVTAYTPNAGHGAVEVTVTPEHWAGAEAGAVGILKLSGGANPVIHCTTGTWQASLDGATTIDSAVAPADGVAHRIKVLWTGTKMAIEVRTASTSALLARVEATYDGSLAYAGTWELVAGAPISVSSLVAYRNGNG